MTARILGALLLVTLAGCASEAPGAASFVGCYALFYSAGERVDSTANHAAPAVRLDTSRYGPGPGNGQYRLSRLTEIGAPPRAPEAAGRIPPTWWLSPAGDSLYLSFVNGFEGASFAFEIPRARADTLRGRTENITDYAPPAGGRDAFAVRIACR